MIPIKYRKFQNLESYVTYSMYLGLSGLVNRAKKINYFTPDTLRAWVLSQPNAQQIWNDFAASNWDTKLAPCLDRIRYGSDFGPQYCQLTTNWKSKLKHSLNPHNVDNLSTGKRGVIYNPNGPHKTKKFRTDIPYASQKLFQRPTTWFLTFEEAAAYRDEFENFMREWFKNEGVLIDEKEIA